MKTSESDMIIRLLRVLYDDVIKYATVSDGMLFYVRSKDMPIGVSPIVFADQFGKIVNLPWNTDLNVYKGKRIMWIDA